MTLTGRAHQLRYRNGTHQRLRAAFGRVVDAGGVRCARGADCFRAELVEREGVVALVGGLIVPGEPWDLGHDDLDPRRYSGPEHRHCNRATAGRKRQRFSREW